MKRPEYVATVTKIYREALDGLPVTQDRLQRLDAAFSRQGFTQDYYLGRPGPQMLGARGQVREDPAFLAAARATYEAVETPRVPVQFYMIVNSYSAMLAVQDDRGNICKVTGPRPEPAVNRPLTVEELSARLRKTGGTCYLCAKVRALVEPGLSLPASAVNAMRREALSELTALRGRREQAPLGRFTRPMLYPGFPGKPRLTVQVTALEQVTPKLLALGPEVLYLPVHLAAEAVRRWPELGTRGKLGVVLPRVVHDRELAGVVRMLDESYEAGARFALVGNLGQLSVARSRGFALCGDFGLNIFNSRAMNTLRDLGLASATASFEMTLPQIRDLSKAVPTELLAYGRLPLMVTENCLIRNRTGRCACASGQTKLLDRMGEEFPVIKDGGACRSVVLNGKKLYWLDRRAELSKLGLWALRLLFTTENPREVDRVLDSWTTGGTFEPGTCTRGLYLRGVE